ncbi:MAG: acyl-ACP--UDP-N-acetylglucosamine O-acyltransferase [Gammaproteobacteria bacterium]|nr:acyl-ACP--UDP-N-acetylglucosamine O-acyltransferase [Gammaproteobacteria bacterium]
MIHATAVVDPRATLATGVEVGAYSIIGADVEIGDGTWIGPHVVIQGPTRIGKSNRIYQFCSIGDAPQHLAYKNEPTRVEIGDRNVLREYCTVNRGTVQGDSLTSIGNDNFIMAYCHVAHDCHLGNNTIFANGSSLAGHVHIGDRAVLGGFTLVHQHCRIGESCMTAANTVLFKDVPPFVMASGFGGSPYGLNLRGLKRRGFDETTINSIKHAYKLLYRSGLRLEEAIEQIERDAHDQPQILQFAEFVKNSSRGIVR